MDKAKKVTDAADEFYNKMQNNENGRYRSWEHCYKVFYEARNKVCSKDDIDYLSLNLAFYLASWGMYRGSSFLLQKDYKIHTPVVKKILKFDYSPLLGIEYNELSKDSNIGLLMNIRDDIKNYYSTIRDSVKSKQSESNISDVLVTKILMGTLGCVPAYDRYFIIGMHDQVKDAINKFNKNSVMRLIDFYKDNEKELETTRKKYKIGSITYPQMKLIDMGFWQIGFNSQNDGEI